MMVYVCTSAVGDKGSSVAVGGGKNPRSFWLGSLLVSYFSQKERVVRISIIP